MISRYVFAPLLVAMLACGEDRAGTSREPAPAEPAPAADDRPVILFLGTSLTAGLGVDVSQAYPALIQQKADSAGLEFRVVNAGVSGETSAGARRRLDWLLQEGQAPVAVLVVETGANDGLRALDPDALRDNLAAILERAREEAPSPELVVVGMEAPPNLGGRYTSEFREVFPEVAAEQGAAFVPFLLDGVAGIDSLNQDDGIHPTSAGQRLMAQTVWEVLEPILRAR